MDVSTMMILTPGPLLDFLLANQNVRILTFKVKNGGNCGDGETKELTVHDYFTNVRNIQLTYSAYTPCLDVGQPKRPNDLPLEIMRLLLLHRQAGRRLCNDYFFSFYIRFFMDFMNRVLILAIKGQGNDKPPKDLIAGGTESSAMTVEWAISELLKEPRIFEKVTEELDRVIGKDRWVEEKDIPHLPYVEAIMKETMRVHPVAPLLVPRLAREDCSINGYDIPSGTRALVNTWTIGRDPEIWDCPDQFYPERFLGKSIDVKGQDFELLPFGSGRRMCPGYSLGLKVIELTLANLLHGFKWRLPDLMSQDELNMEEIFGLSTPRKVPLEAVIEPRLPTHVYNIY